MQTYFNNVGVSAYFWNIMKQILKILAVAAVLTISVSSCKKYTDGPGFSLRSKKARMCGDWKLKASNVNGNDLSLSDDDKDNTMKIEKDDKFTFVDPGSADQTGTWKFEDGKKKVTWTVDLGGQQPYVQKNEILMLKNKEMKLKYEDIFGDVRIDTYEQ